jgi:mannose-6-phosphate isomerase-like protein (cupin superfamily)
VSYRVVRPSDWTWITRPHDAGRPARHVVEISPRAEFSHTRANVWRYEPGAVGRRHRDKRQEETFLVLSGTLSLHLGDPPVREDVPAHGLVHVDAGTPLQVANHGDEDLLLYAYGAPPETGQAEMLDPAV